jgi:hypothetical protein
MKEEDRRPPVWVGHVVLETNRFEESAQFMRSIGMRTIYPGPNVGVFELRGGTHLILLDRNDVVPGEAKFDLMVEDLHATHRHFAAIGLDPSPIEAVPHISHEMFRVREPAGHVITFYSNHVSNAPV